LATRAVSLPRCEARSVTARCQALPHAPEVFLPLSSELRKPISRFGAAHRPPAAIDNIFIHQAARQMRSFSILQFLLVIFLTACAAEGPNYVVTPVSRHPVSGQPVSSQPVSREAAQELLIQSISRHQLAVPTDRPLRPIRIILPSFPRSLQDAVINSSIEIRFTIDETGKVVNPIAVGKSYRPLADNVIEAILQWQFEPSTRDGKPISVPFVQRFTFKTAD
jgi:TonB family protein